MEIFQCFKKVFNITESEHGFGKNIIWGIHKNNKSVFFDVAIPLTLDDQYKVAFCQLIESIVNEYGYVCDSDFVDENNDSIATHMMLTFTSSKLQRKTPSFLSKTLKLPSFSVEQHTAYGRKILNDLDIFSDYQVAYSCDENKIPSISYFCTRNMKRDTWVIRQNVLAFKTKRDGMYFKLKMP